MSDLELRHLHKSFEKEKVLHDVNLEVKSGEFVVLVGPSGCGKSTLLRIIAGLEEADAGEVRIKGNDMRHTPPQHRNVAMVFQNYALYPHKTVGENLTFGLLKTRLSKTDIQKRMKQVAATLQIEAMLDKKPAQLSGGQQQRVAMGRAIIRDADLFLYDEPLSNLDAALRRQMRREIKQIHNIYQRTSIYVTHDQVEAMTLGDKIAVIKNGVIQQQGSPMEVYLNPANLFVAQFIGAPPMNILEAVLHHTHVEINGHRAVYSGDPDLSGISLPAGGKPIKMGIRPEFIFDKNLMEDMSPSWGIFENTGVRMVEPLGFDQEVEVMLGEQHLNAKLDFRSQVHQGDSLTLCFDWNRVVFFDPDTGENLFGCSDKVTE